MNGHGVLDSRWITVDLGRILRLPDRLRRLWPSDLLPQTDNDGSVGPTPSGRCATRPPGSAVPDGDGHPPELGGHPPSRAAVARAAASAGITLTAPSAAVRQELPAEVVRPRDLDVLSAWLAGFAAELDLARTRMALVVGAESSAVHLEIAMAADSCLAMLALRGADNADFAGYEFLRRLVPGEVASVCEDLSDLVAGDCVLTLTCLGSSADGQPARAGMEFLHRQAGRWSRPLLERGENGMTVARTEEMPDGAVRMVVASMLTRLRFAEVGSP